MTKLDNKLIFKHCAFKRLLVSMEYLASRNEWAIKSCGFTAYSSDPTEAVSRLMLVLLEGAKIEEAKAPKNRPPYKGD